MIPVYKPQLLGSIYLLLVPLFGVIYYFNPTFWKEPLTFIQSIYFSVITITTLGYGDITPATEVARLLTAVEALSGIIIIGLFLNAIAHTRTEFDEAKKRAVFIDHLSTQYREFRRNVAEICLRAEIRGLNFDHELAKELATMTEFRKYFKKNSNENWYKVLNGLEDERSTLEDLFIEIDLLIQQVNYTLNNIHVRDKDALRLLTRFSQHTYRLRHADIYSDDPVRYIGGFIWDVMAGWSVIDGFREHDIIQITIDKI